MTRFALTLAAFAALSLGSSASAAPVFVIKGFGWGHGIGLSQYGASGLAAQGSTHEEILAHYYRNTSLSSVEGSRIRVLVHVPDAGFRVSSAAPFTVRGSDGVELSLAAGATRVNRQLAVMVNDEQHRLALPLTFAPDGSPLAVAGRPYRGRLVVHDTADGVLVVNGVALEKYLYGVVPDEMPPLWDLEALKAQAVAARSYALATRRTSGVFDAYDDTRSQVYGGLESEHSRSTQAVNETRGQVVSYQGLIATTFFFSTSGGRTASIEDVWPSVGPVPYLRTVADPTDAASPFHRWGPIVYTRRGLQRALAEDAPRGLRDVTTTSNKSRRVDRVVLTGGAGEQVLDGAAVRTRLGLRSTGFRVGVLDVEALEAPVGFARRIAVRGLARKVAGAVLEERIDNSWSPVRKIKPEPDGRFVVVYRPRRTTTLRVATPDLADSRVRPPTIRVEVIARATLERRPRRVFTGIVRPKEAGALVELQRHGKRRWRTVARDQTARSGRYRFKLKTRPPGEYRVVATIEDDGIGPGVSQTLSVRR